MKEKLEQIDEILSSYEDWMHGIDGKKCSLARKLLIEVITDLNNIEILNRLDKIVSGIKEENI